MIMKHVRQSPASVTQAVLAGVTPGGSGQGAGNGKIEAEYGRQQTAEAEAYGRWFMAGDYGRRITAVWQRGWKTAVWRRLGGRTAWASRAASGARAVSVSVASV